MPFQNNSLLSRLPPLIVEAITPHLSTVSFYLGEVLGETHEQLTKVYFPHSGIISSVVELIGGGAIETGMIGKDGVFGAAHALDDKVCLNHVMIQIVGEASIMSSESFVKIAETFPEFRRIMISYEQFFLAQVQQTAACNAVHKVPQRFCKWLLRMHDLVGNDLTLTQEFMAQMMGVRRTSVSAVAIELQQSGLIAYSRGRVRIVDLEGVYRRACECHDELGTHYKRLFV